jgi:hypothetical protein
MSVYNNLCPKHCQTVLVAGAIKPTGAKAPAATGCKPEMACSHATRQTPRRRYVKREPLEWPTGCIDLFPEPSFSGERGEGGKLLVPEPRSKSTMADETKCGHSAQKACRKLLLQMSGYTGSRDWVCLPFYAGQGQGRRESMNTANRARSFTRGSLFRSFGAGMRPMTATNDCDVWTDHRRPSAALTCGICSGANSKLRNP